MPPFQRNLIGFLCVVALRTSAASVVTSTVEQRTDADRTWVSSNYQSVLTALLSIDKGEGEYVAYRFVYEFLVKSREYSFVIEHERCPNTGDTHDCLVARVRVADSKPIREQMFSLHSKYPQEGPPDIEKRIKLRTWDLRDATCPAIRVQFDRFLKIQFKAPRFSIVILDAPVHEIRAKSNSGSMKLRIPDWDDPAVVWAVETRRALAECGAKESIWSKAEE
jgi:hypothetical protein